METVRTLLESTKQDLEMKLMNKLETRKQEEARCEHDWKKIREYGVWECLKCFECKTENSQLQVNKQQQKELLCEMMRKDEEDGVYDDINEIKQLPQRQDSLTEQLRDLRLVANKLGMYDAVDYIKETTHQDNKLREAAERVVKHLGECALDHHGLCQEHYLEDDCMVKKLKEALNSKKH